MIPATGAIRIFRTSIILIVAAFGLTVLAGQSKIVPQSRLFEESIAGDHAQLTPATIEQAHLRKFEGTTTSSGIGADDAYLFLPVVRVPALLPTATPPSMPTTHLFT